MRIVLDNNVTQRLAPLILGHDIVRSRQLGWSGPKNGELIKASEEAGFEVLITADKNMLYQQNITGRKIRIVLLSNWRITLNQLTPIVPNLQDAMSDLKEGSFVTVTLDGWH